MGVLKRIYSDPELRRQYKGCFRISEGTPKQKRTKRTFKLKRKGGIVSEKRKTKDMFIEYAIISMIVAGLVITALAILMR